MNSRITLARLKSSNVKRFWSIFQINLPRFSMEAIKRLVFTAVFEECPRTFDLFSLIPTPSTLHKKIRPKKQETADLVTFTEEILDGKPIFCAVKIPSFLKQNKLITLKSCIIKQIKLNNIKSKRI